MCTFTILSVICCPSKRKISSRFADGYVTYFDVSTAEM